MPNIASILKQEITRLARKEAKAATETVRKASTQYRRDIAELKRQNASLSKQVAFLEKQERKRAGKAAPASDAAGKRFSPRWLKTHREKLEISATDYGTLVGVSGQTIYNWEAGKTKPRAQQLAALASVRSLGKREAWKRLEE